jgi:hypothetical protein
MPPRKRRKPQTSVTTDFVAGVVGGIAGAKRARGQTQMIAASSQFQTAQMQAEYEQRLQAEALRHRRAEQLSDYLKLTPTEFESAVAELLAYFGYRLTLVGGAGDLSVDLDGTNQNGERTVVQCKRYGPGRKVGTPELQQFIGMAYVHHRAQEALFVTTVEFSQPARELADRTAGLYLVDGALLANMTEQRNAGVSPPPFPETPDIGFAAQGRRYSIGGTSTYFAIWDRLNPSQPIATYAPGEDSWRQAWDQYQAWEAYVAPPPPAPA